MPVTENSWHAVHENVLGRSTFLQVQKCQKEASHGPKAPRPAQRVPKCLKALLSLPVRLKPACVPASRCSVRVGVEAEVFYQVTGESAHVIY